jgi:hypothetical protein
VTQFKGLLLAAIILAVFFFVYSQRNLDW